ncbi:TetR family transcriptional regulator [Actinospica durhamensis]|uniref:TetR family transcriptional regulator n=1 Tax=Actinospica durhamensis TaxID=1508375 RepID=A0A941EVI8_9ACTN|nr:TetR family transcriptional regulator [Actinospica durhamensis]MBR7838555.1 TetR family transcriptional regulator [Actinospica durhamensis]
MARSPQSPQSPDDPGSEPQGARRARRFDPERGARILDAALDVLAEVGVAGTTHRLVAARADVPLGSVTYHFSSLADLQAQAFARYVELQSAQFGQLLAGVETTERLAEVLTGFVHGGPARRRSARLGFELHLAALRDPALRALTQAWTDHSRSALARFTSPDNAARLDALLEGMIMHALLATVEEARATTRAAIARTLDEAPATKKGR